MIFEDVLAYQFQHDVLQTIIFDIEEVDLTQLVQAQSAQFDAGCKWGWPLGWESSKESVPTYVERLGMKAFELTSSYGMTGWVLAKSMTKLRRN